jgi:NADPH-dependent 2,4-dienoyl-CoA reductase/sulfur reductase-like enzyme
MPPIHEPLTMLQAGLWPESSQLAMLPVGPIRTPARRIRVEHWVVGERMGQVPAKNILGRREKFDTVPFFWSQHYDVAISYLGHAEKWETIEIDGSLDARDCAVAYKKGGRTLATVTISRDLQSLLAEAAREAAIRRPSDRLPAT